MFPRCESDLRLVCRRGFYVPDRNCDYFLLQRLMAAAGLSARHGTRLLIESDEYDRVLAVCDVAIEVRDA